MMLGYEEFKKEVVKMWLDTRKESDALKMIYNVFGGEDWAIHSNSEFLKLVSGGYISILDLANCSEGMENDDFIVSHFDERGRQPIFDGFESCREAMEFVLVKSEYDMKWCYDLYTCKEDFEEQEPEDVFYYNEIVTLLKKKEEPFKIEFIGDDKESNGIKFFESAEELTKWAFDDNGGFYALAWGFAVSWNHGGDSYIIIEKKPNEDFTRVSNNINLIEDDATRKELMLLCVDFGC